MPFALNNGTIIFQRAVYSGLFGLDQKKFLEYLYDLINVFHAVEVSSTLAKQTSRIIYLTNFSMKILRKYLWQSKTLYTSTSPKQTEQLDNGKQILCLYLRFSDYAFFLEHKNISRSSQSMPFCAGYSTYWSRLEIRYTGIFVHPIPTMNFMWKMENRKRSIQSIFGFLNKCWSMMFLFTTQCSHLWRARCW